MTVPEPADAAAWVQLVADLEAQVERVEWALTEGDWTTLAATGAVAVPGRVPAAHQAAVRRIVSRLGDLEQRMTDELHTTRMELDELGLRRRAARGYQRSAPTGA